MKPACRSAAPSALYQLQCSGCAAGEAEAADAEASPGQEQLRKAVRFQGLSVELRQLPASPEARMQASSEHCPVKVMHDETNAGMLVLAHTLPRRSSIA